MGFLKFSHIYLSKIHSKCTGDSCSYVLQFIDLLWISHLLASADAGADVGVGAGVGVVVVAAAAAAAAAAACLQKFYIF